MYEVTVYYDDGTQLDFPDINKIGFYDSGNYITICGEDIVKHSFSLHKTYDFYSEKSSTAISDQNLRCIDISKM